MWRRCAVKGMPISRQAISPGKKLSEVENLDWHLIGRAMAYYSKAEEAAEVELPGLLFQLARFSLQILYIFNLLKIMLLFQELHGGG